MELVNHVHRLTYTDMLVKSLVVRGVCNSDKDARRRTLSCEADSEFEYDSKLGAGDEHHDVHDANLAKTDK